MAEILRPRDDRELAEAVAWAAAEGRPLEVVGAGSKRALGRPINAEVTLALGDFGGIEDYQPTELIITARAGTPLAEIEAALAERGQMLAFEPPDLAPLLGETAGRATLGGVVACNLSGPRRFKAGGARDHVLGIHAVSGRGESFKTGGRVVKNVTGYDLCKLLTGSFGTLAVISRITLKVLPAPETVTTLTLGGLDDAAAVALMAAIARGRAEANGLACLPPRAAARLGLGAGGSLTAIRLEGPEPSVAERAAALRAALAKKGVPAVVDGAQSRAIWQAIGQVAPLIAADAEAVWRLSTPPTAGARIAARIAAQIGADYFFDWAGGLIWLACAREGDGGAAVIRQALAETGGHATLVRADADLRARVPVFEPLAPALAALSARVKDSFDPRRVLNPGRIYAGM